MRVYIITRDEKNKPLEIMGVWSEWVRVEEALDKFYGDEPNPLVEYDTHEWEID